EPCAAERAIDTGGLGIADVVMEGRHTPWFERHVPASRRADLRPHLPWLGSCQLREPLSPAQLAAIELFLYTDFVTTDLRTMSPALAGSFTGPVAQCLSLGTATPSRLVKRRWNAIDRLRHQGAAQALPQPMQRLQSLQRLQLLQSLQCLQRQQRLQCRHRQHGQQSAKAEFKDNTLSLTLKDLDTLECLVDGNTVIPMTNILKRHKNLFAMCDDGHRSRCAAEHQVQEGHAGRRHGAAAGLKAWVCR
ncbi:MAG: hypothetical protein SOT14_05490, partial [Succinivibrio sp.]|nr:hypothetical protein [Succinivibrio sp.]